MKINKTKLLFIATLLFLAIPLVFSGNAGATFKVDGAVHNNTSTGWLEPQQTTTDKALCTDAAHATGYAGINSRPDCEAIRLTSYTTSADCTGAGAASWRAVCTKSDGTPISLKGQDRNATNCTLAGGTWASACVGKWAYTQTYSGNDQCLRCHSNITEYTSNMETRKSSYLKTGHKNMLRKVDAGAPWEGPDGAVYTADGNGNHIDWASATISRTDVTPTGNRALYYIYGDWIAAGVSAVFDNSAGGDGTSAKYTCASCHTTGYVATNFAAGMKPATDYPGITTGITGSWQISGIVCTRCHGVNADSTDAGSSHHTSGVLSGGGVAAVCGSCHNTKDLTVTANKTVSGGKFASHMIGPEFLNSPHARFAYTTAAPAAADIANSANYGSHFSTGGSCAKAGTTTEVLKEWNTKTVCTNNGGTWTAATTTTQGNCTTCHDVHDSLVVDGQEPFKRECGISCHASKGDLSTIKHPNTPGTPLYMAEEAGNVSEACTICHMAVYGGQSQTPHIFRINTSAGYSTFTANGSGVNTSAEGAFTKAVWLDLDLACGQCHGGSKGDSATLYGAPYMSKAYLAAVAKGMHQGDTASTTPTAAFAPGSPSSASMAATVVDASKNADSVKINWGDGSSVNGSAGGTFTHTYKVGGTYPVTLTAYNAESGLSNSITTSVMAASAKYAISGTVTYVKADASSMTPAKGAMVVVKKAATGNTVWYQRNVQTDGDSNPATPSYTTTGLNSGKSYSVSAVLKNFSCIATPSPASLTADTTVNILCTRNF